jgi:hypothetical protein
MSRRTETAYKAQSPGKLAPHDETLDSGDRVNAAAVQRKFTFLSGEICPTRSVLSAWGIHQSGNWYIKPGRIDMLPVGTSE